MTRMSQIITISKSASQPIINCIIANFRVKDIQGALMIQLTKQTPGMVAQELAQRVKKRRKEHRLTQAQLATAAGISLSTYKRFERKGQISFLPLLWIANELGCMEEFNELFTNPYYESLEDIDRAFARAAKEARQKAQK